MLLMKNAKQQINFSGKLRNASRLSKERRRGYILEASRVNKKGETRMPPLYG